MDAELNKYLQFLLEPSALEIEAERRGTVMEHIRGSVLAYEASLSNKRYAPILQPDDVQQAQVLYSKLVSSLHWHEKPRTIWRLIPPFMNAETKGPAVRWWKQLLSCMTYDTGDSLYDGPINEYYDHSLQLAVQRLQRFMGFKDDEDIDGYFGPKSRKRFQELFFIDLDQIPGESQDVTYYAAPGFDTLQEWIPGVTVDPRNEAA